MNSCKLYRCVYDVFDSESVLELNLVVVTLTPRTPCAHTHTHTYLLIFELPPQDSYVIKNCDMFLSFRDAYICISRIKVLERFFFNFWNFVLPYWLDYFSFETSRIFFLLVLSQRLRQLISPKHRRLLHFYRNDWGEYSENSDSTFMLKVEAICMR